ncbi:hypothetical protein [Pseudomonas sp. W5-36]|uniref:glycine-rich domain-containing protein n=1 Tax=Pseudomonas sp. W5-36 TaxID=3097455 RepID=UPI00397AF4F7
MDYPKSVPNVGLVGGKFVDENTATGTPGSLIPAAWGNAVTDEILAVINNGGLAAAESDPAQLVQAIRAGAFSHSGTTGGANTYKASYAPEVVNLVDGMTLRFRANTTNTGAATFAPNKIAARNILNLSQNSLVGGEITAGGYCTVTYSATFDCWLLVSASGGTFLSGRLIGVQAFTLAGGTYVPALGTNFVVVEVQGGGGGGGGAPATASGAGSAGGGGGAGGYSCARLTSGFAGVAVTLGAGGAGGTASPSSGGTGGISSFGSLVSASGGGGGSFMAASASFPIQAAGANGAVGGAGNVVAGPGAGGGAGVILASGNGISGAGGPSHFGGGGFKAVGSAPGGAGVYGGGGGGAISQSNTGGGFAGGAGGMGLVIVWEYA